MVWIGSKISAATRVLVLVFPPLRPTGRRQVGVRRGRQSSVRAHLRRKATQRNPVRL